ncbi:MAG: hypothetical protein Q9M09_01155 [Mariprofundaceae bacterium]|nr:hypothetical protein [Mariprofundaceae bacterium]
MNKLHRHNNSCRCFLRKISTNYDAVLREDDVPEGYCGRCCECNKLGHTRLHPHQGYQDAWCDEHWQEVLTQPFKPWYRRRSFIAFIIGLGAIALLADCS